MRLLIVDDEFFEIEALLKDIRKEEIGIDEILVANSCSQAVNLFMERQIDLLLCDIEMPYASGLDLVEWVRENRPETECIFLTCHDECDFARQAVRLKCLDYLLKPVEAESINRVLKNGVDYINGKHRDDVYREYGRKYFDVMTQSQGEEQQDLKDAVEKVENYIAMNIDTEMTVEELAQMVYISPAHLSRLFKRKHQMTVNNYLKSERMKVAKELLENTSLSLAAVSAKSGYGNYTYFTTIFKRTYGKTPREYRQEKQRKSGQGRTSG